MDRKKMLIVGFILLMSIQAIVIFTALSCAHKRIDKIEDALDQIVLVED